VYQQSGLVAVKAEYLVAQMPGNSYGVMNLVEIEMLLET
jgi:hypothetical protein